MNPALVIAMAIVIGGIASRPYLADHVHGGSGLRNSPLGSILSNLVYLRSQKTFHRGAEHDTHDEVAFSTPRDWLYRQTLPPHETHTDTPDQGDSMDMACLDGSTCLMRAALWLDVRNSRAGLDAAFLERVYLNGKTRAWAIMENILPHVPLLTVKEQADFWVLSGLWSWQDKDTSRLAAAQAAIRALPLDQLDHGMSLQCADVLGLRLK